MPVPVLLMVFDVMNANEVKMIPESTLRSSTKNPKIQIICISNIRYGNFCFSGIREGYTLRIEHAQKAIIQNMGNTLDSDDIYTCVTPMCV